MRKLSRILAAAGLLFAVGCADHPTDGAAVRELPRTSHGGTPVNLTSVPGTYASAGLAVDLTATVTATGYTTPYTYHWEREIDGGGWGTSLGTTTTNRLRTYYPSGVSNVIYSVWVEDATGRYVGQDQVVLYTSSGGSGGGGGGGGGGGSMPM